MPTMYFTRADASTRTFLISCGCTRRKHGSAAAPSAPYARPKLAPPHTRKMTAAGVCAVASETHHLQRSVPAATARHTVSATVNAASSCREGGRTSSYELRHHHDHFCIFCPRVRSKICRLLPGSCSPAPVDLFYVYLQQSLTVTLSLCVARCVCHHLRLAGLLPRSLATREPPHDQAGVPPSLPPFPRLLLPPWDRVRFVREVVNR